MTSSIPFLLIIVIEVGGLALVAFQHRWLNPRYASRSVWGLLGLGLTFGSGLLLASLALIMTSEQFPEGALSLAAMSIGASLFGFALYHIRPAAKFHSESPFGPAWKQLAAVSYSAFIGGFVLFYTWAGFLVE